MLLQVDKLGVTSGPRPLLADISFSLNGGDRLVVLGHSGAGKSLLLAAIAGLLPPALARTGAVTLADADSVAAALGKRVAVLPLAAESGFHPHALLGDQLGATAADLFTAAGLDPLLARRLPDALPAASLRLLALARLLAASPDLLIADDPCVGLDLIGQRRIVDLITRHTRERGMALIVTTNDLKLAAQLGTRVLVLYQGKALESGTLDDVFGRPRQEFTRRVMTAGRARSKTLMRAPIGGPLLDVKNLGLRIRRPDRSIVQPLPPLVVLDAISFALRQGESLAITGPHGSGKTALLRLIAGLDRATSGELLLDGEAYHGDDIATPLRRDIGIVFSDPRRSFNPRLSVGESIAEPLRLESLKPMDELSDRIVDMVRVVGFAPEVMVRPPSDFTLGQLQRLSLARALMTRPRLILLDDPLAHLDVLARGDLLSMLARLRADFGLTLIVAGHDFEPIRMLADRVIVLDQGRIVETGTPATLLEKPQHAVTQALMAAALPDVSIVPVF